MVFKGILLFLMDFKGYNTFKGIKGSTTSSLGKLNGSNGFLRVTKGVSVLRVN